MKLTEVLNEVAAKWEKVIRDGKVVRKKTCPAGYKLVDGACVRQDAKERKNRSKGSRRAMKKSRSSRARNRLKSLRLRQRRNLD